MAASGKTIRVFVSSTFSDLKAERNVLQARVFPELRLYCAARGWHFQAVDLRWGVSEEAGHDQRTMRICLKEIVRCRNVSPRPNFLVLLGDRYGWRPLPEEIPFFEFEALLKSIPPAAADLLEWREDQPEDRKGWYRRDDNILVHRGSERWEPGMFVLRPREGRFRDLSVWETEVERPLHEALERAAAGMNLPDAARIKYGASATEQEIHHGAFWVPDAREHVLAFCRTLTGEDRRPLSDAATSGKLSAPNPADPLRHFMDFDADGSLESDARVRQQSLRERLRGHIGDQNYMEYRVPWRGGEPDNEYLSRLCADVRAGLERIIREQIAQFKDLTLGEIERQQHENFARERTQIFVGREEPLRRIAGYLRQDSPGRPLAVLGVSGSGKSALLARAIEDARRSHPDSHILVRYIGATPASSDVRALIESLCRELGECYGLSNAELPGEYEKLIGVFRERLAAATEQMPLIIFLDALDQLGESHNAHALAWLPFELSEHVHVVVSAIAPDGTAGECGEVLSRRLPVENRIEVEPLAEGEAEEALAALLAREEPALASGCGTIRCALTGNQRAAVMAGFRACPLPLYLRIAAEQSRLWPTWRPASPLPNTVEGLMIDLFNRLADPREHGPLLVDRALSYLRCAKNGLSEDELLEILPRDEKYWQYFLAHAKHELVANEKRLPAIVWLRLYHDLDRYLTHRAADGAALLNFFHRQLGEAVDRLYLVGDQKPASHAVLARYFAEQPLATGDDDHPVPTLRKLSELPFQYAWSGAMEPLAALLLDFDFMAMKLIGFNIGSLIADYALRFVARKQTVASSAAQDAHDEPLRLVEDALRLSSHILSREDLKEHRAAQLMGQLTGRLWGFNQPEIKKLRGWAHAPAHPPALAILPRFGGLVHASAPLIRTLEGHTGYVNVVALFADGHRAISASEDNTLIIWDLDAGQSIGRPLAGHTNSVADVVVFADGHKAISAGNVYDKTLRIWDLNTGKPIGSPLDGYSPVVVFATGHKAISASADNTLRIWNIDTGMPIGQPLEGHTSLSTAIAVFANGHKAISASQDKTLRIWNLDTGKPIGNPLKGHTARVNAVAVFAGGHKAVSASDDRTIRIWNLDTGEPVGQPLKGHVHDAIAVSVFAGGHKAVSAAGGGWLGSHSKDETLRIWNLDTGEQIGQSLQGHTAWINTIAIFADGHKAISASEDKTLRIWDLDTGEPIGQPLEGHTWGVTAVAIFADGHKAISGSEDKTLRIWNLDTAESIKPGGAISSPEAGHKERVTTVAVFADGNKAISGSIDKTLRIWNLNTGEPVGQALTGHTWWVTAVAVFGDGHKAISASDAESNLRIWNLDTGQPIGRSLEGHNLGIRAIAVFADGRKVLSASQENALRISNLDDGRSFICPLKDRTLNRHWLVRAIAVFAEGHKAVSAQEQTLRIWNLKNGKAIGQPLVGHTEKIKGIAVFADGHKAISASSDYTLRLWNLDTGQSIGKPLNGHGSSVEAVVAFVDGHKAISVSQDGTARIWNLDTSECLAIFAADAPLECVALSPDESMIVTGDEWGQVLVLDILDRESMRLARRKLADGDLVETDILLNKKNIQAECRPNEFQAQQLKGQNMLSALWRGFQYMLFGKKLMR